ncbi:hypothetical protein [Sphingobium yanoikuyae]|uniref:hypothetical protein n=1 Tax=Sphingobium yanoikuyae TaxID=13690 RepID=UPI0028967992|nr:hypothetical protein [Sphingobium yanoikuyae]
MMVSRIHLAAVLLPLSSLLSGCISAGSARVEPVTMAVYPDGQRCGQVRKPQDVRLNDRQPDDFRPGAIDLSCFRFPEDENVDAEQPAANKKQNARLTAYARAAGNSADRNRLAAILLKQADDVCTSEKALLLKRQAEVNGWLSIATTGLSTVSTIVTGELAKSILSGGAAITSGSRDHVNTHVYRNQIIQTITKAIDTERSRIFDVMKPNLALDSGKYNVDAMIRDVNAYHQACSFGTGLQIVMDAVEKREAFEKMDKIQKIDDQIRTLRDSRDRQLATAATDTALELLEKERVRLATGITVDAPDAN